MTDEKIEKVSPRILEEINRYGEAVPPPAAGVTEAPDLVEELRARGIEPTDDDVPLLRDQVQWPAEVRAALLAVLEAAEGSGVRYRIDFRHDAGTEAVGLPTISVSLVGP